MKKIICALVLLLMAAALAGCGAEKEESADLSNIDVDLTTLSSTMAYSEVYNIMNTPKEYAGKTIKMEGVASSFYDEAEKQTYYACVIKDATACCAQGLEYVLAEEGAAYPKDDQKITVVGELQEYTTKDGTSYCTLKDAALLAAE